MSVTSHEIEQEEMAKSLKIQRLQNAPRLMYLHFAPDRFNQPDYWPCVSSLYFAPSFRDWRVTCEPIPSAGPGVFYADYSINIDPGAWRFVYHPECGAAPALPREPEIEP